MALCPTWESNIIFLPLTKDLVACTPTGMSVWYRPMQYMAMLRPPTLHLIRVCVMHAQATHCVFLCQNDGNMQTFASGL
jgi:hypothetical protein